MFRHCNIYGSMIEGKTGSDRPALEVYFHGVVTSSRISLSGLVTNMLMNIWGRAIMLFVYKMKFPEQCSFCRPIRMSRCQENI